MCQFLAEQAVLELPAFPLLALIPGFECTSTHHEPFVHQSLPLSKAGTFPELPLPAVENPDIQRPNAILPFGIPPGCILTAKECPPNRLRRSGIPSGTYSARDVEKTTNHRYPLILPSGL